MTRGLLLRGIRINPARDSERARRLPFLSRGPVDIQLRRPLTFLIGENGCGKTTLLEAIAARCAIRPGGGGSYAETEDERADTALSAAVEVTFGGGHRPKGVFLRADRFAEMMAQAGSLPMPATGEWRRADEQSRGEGVLSLLTARVDASEGMLFILDEPETGLSPQRQIALLRLLDALHGDGRSQAVVATHSPILMSHPGCDRLWIDATGVTRRALADIAHWRDMQRFMASPADALDQLLDGASAGERADAGKPDRPIRLWVLSDLHLEAVPYPEAFRPVRPAFDVLVVAGDVWEGDCRRALETVAALADGKPAVFVMGGAGQGSTGASRWEASEGDHESWHSALQRARDVARRTAHRLGITLLDDSEAEVAGISFVGGTLWADGRRAGEPIQVLGDGPARLMTAGDAAVLHERTRGVIEAAMARLRAAPLVVVTHHPPLPVCLPSPAADLSHLTDSGRAAVWVHGHRHDTIDETRPGGTRIVCNAAGPGFTNPAFRDDWVIEVWPQSRPAQAD